MNYKIAESSESQREEAVLKLDRIGREILGICRDELYFSMRFMDVALSSFAYQMDAAASPFGTDGYRMYFHPQELGGLYRENRILVNRGYLHMVLHCIFRHMIKRGMDSRYWNLSCDIAAEHIIDGCDLRPVRCSGACCAERHTGGWSPRSCAQCGENIQGAESMGAHRDGVCHAGGRVLYGRPSGTGMIRPVSVRRMRH